MQPFGTKTFQTRYGKLVISKVNLKQAEALRNIVSEPEVNKFLLVELPVKLSSTQERIKDRGYYWFVATLNGVVVGSVDLRPGSGRAKHVSNFGIAFSKKVHGKGIASIVLESVFDYAKKNGIEIISSKVFSDNPRARTFYKNHGFEEVGVLKNHLKRDGKYLDEILIVKKL